MNELYERPMYNVPESCVSLIEEIAYIYYIAPTEGFKILWNVLEILGMETGQLKSQPDKQLI